MEIAIHAIAHLPGGKEGGTVMMMRAIVAEMYLQYNPFQMGLFA
jgi:hypothetical protein